MRFDDSLATVLAADAAPGFGAQAAWRQLVDLAGRGRVPDLDAALDRLRSLRDRVPVAVRTASARSIVAGAPPVALVALFAADEPGVAAALLRAVTLDAADWQALLPQLSPASRAILRHRRDLPDQTVRALTAFGPIDFVLGHDGEADVTVPVEDGPAVIEPAPAAGVPSSPNTPFVAVGDVARGLPVVEEAMRQAADPPRFEIADLVARIDAFRRKEPVTPPAPRPPADRFDFHTDAAGVIRWVEGVARAPLSGVDLTDAGQQGLVRLDPAIGDAVRRRTAFRDVGVHVGGETTAAGAWRLAGIPRFDPITGQFTGMAGHGRRPRATAPVATSTGAADSLRQLVHELRTPTSAIVGFSELIGTELFGTVPPVYRERAELIGREAAQLTAAIDDLDLAARLDSGALELRATAIDLSVLIAEAVTKLQPLAAERRSPLAAEVETAAPVFVDERVAQRLVDRLFTAALAVAEPGEQLRAQVQRKTRSVRLHLSRPRALTLGEGEGLFDATPQAGGDEGLLLGVGFTLRLLRDLAVAAGGALQLAPDRLTLRLPTAVTAEMERTSAQ